jgi:phosphonate metabolism protein PhnN/1,5-bisphosphokinase (PRPP-forming)
VAIDAAIAGGQIVVLNGSRGVIDAARQRYPRLAVIEVSAPPAVLAMRLAARGREDQESIRKRLERSVSAVADHPDVFRVSNDGDVASGISTLLTVLQGLTA